MDSSMDSLSVVSGDDMTTKQKHWKMYGLEEVPQGYCFSTLFSLSESSKLCKKWNKLKCPATYLSGPWLHIKYKTDTIPMLEINHTGNLF